MSKQIKNSSSVWGHPDTFSFGLEMLELEFATPLARGFDVFLSYKSEDHLWVEKLRDALKGRGVRVWVDKDQIRPGDRFAQALEEGITSSGSVCIVVTPESVASNWVKEEYYRALSLANEGQLQLIPIILRNAKLPAFLANRQHIDFSDPSLFEINVDRLIWPGITGQEIVFYTLPYYESLFAPPTFDETQLAAWRRLVRFGQELGWSFGRPDAGRVYRMRRSTEDILREGSRLVVIANIFDETDYYGVQQPLYQTYIDFILELRERTKGRRHEVVFLFYHPSNAWETETAKLIKPEIASRLRAYFTIHDDVPNDKTFTDELAHIWRTQIQWELLDSVHRAA